MTVIFSIASCGGTSTDIALALDAGIARPSWKLPGSDVYGGGDEREPEGPATGCGAVLDPAAKACCESNDGPAAGLGFDFSPNGDVSRDTPDIRSAACSVESARLSSGRTASALPTDAGPLTPPSPSILLIPNDQRSRCDVEPKDDDGEGNGCEPVMNTDSERGVWFPPRPREGGTPTRRVGGGVADADWAASSASMIDSTSSIQMSTFSGLRSVKRRQKTEAR